MKIRKGSAPGGPTVEREAPMLEATRRIQEIIDDADRQAGQIIINAEVEARNYVAAVKKRTDQEAIEYARAMSALSDALIGQAELLSREARRLLAEHSDEGFGAELEFAPSSFDQLGEPDVAEAAAEPGAATTLERDEPLEFAEPAAPIELNRPAEPYSAGARLLATQMAVAGATREDIRDRLVNDFGIDRPEPLLDSILGPG